MGKKNSAGFHDYYADDDNVSPAQRAKIEFEVELIGKLIEAREAKILTQKQGGYYGDSNGNTRTVNGRR